MSFTWTLRRWRILLACSLIISVPVGVVLVAPAAYAWCGDSSCFGHRDPVGTLIFLALATAIATVPLFVIPWARYGRIRFTVATLSSAVFATLGFLAVLWLGAHE